jgi:hypothetical protein
MMTKELAMENLFRRPDDHGWTRDMFAKVRQRLASKHGENGLCGA